MISQGRNSAASPKEDVPVDVVTHRLGIHSDFCFFCRGFYGPSFNQPVCGPCHAFLFPENINQLEGVEDSGSSVHEEKDDSEDSGNEEPTDFLTTVLERKQRVPVISESSNRPNTFLDPNLPVPLPTNLPLAPSSLNSDNSSSSDGAGSSCRSDQASGLSISRLVSQPGSDVASALLRPSSMRGGRFSRLSGTSNSVSLHSVKSEKLAEKILQLTTTKDKEIVPPRLVDSLPPEVLVAVFSYLDDMSLWTAMQVSPRWRQIIHDEYPEEKWKTYLQERWPLFEPLINTLSWRTSYSRLIESAPCKLCLEKMMIQNTPQIEENSWRHRRLRSELKALQSDPPEGIQATPLDRLYCHWQATITGPQGSPYEGGSFFLYMQIPPSYPMKPPIVRFLTRTFHPNISRHGDIGLDSIHHNWSLALTISKVLISIQSLLTDPYIHTSMEPQIGQLIKTDLAEYNRIARIWTWRYAMHDVFLSTDPDFFDGS